MKRDEEFDFGEVIAAAIGVVVGVPVAVGLIWGSVALLKVLPVPPMYNPSPEQYEWRGN